MSPAAQEEAAVFARDAVCEQTNDTVIKNLKELPRSNFDRWIGEPMVAKLRHTEPPQIGRNFLLVGDNLITEWQDEVRNVFSLRTHATWNPNQIADALLIGSGSPEIVLLAGSELPIYLWLAPIANWTTWVFINGQNTKFRGISLAELHLRHCYKINWYTLLTRSCGMLVK